MTADARRETDPSIVALVRLVPVEGGWWAKVYCSGTLVAPRVVVTASHCVHAADGLEAQGQQLWVTNVTDFEGDAYGWMWVDSPADLAANATWSRVDDNVLNPLYNTSPQGTLGYREDVSAQVIAHELAGVDSFPALPQPGVLDAMQADKTLRSTTLTVSGYGSQAREQNGTRAFLASNERRSADLFALALSEQWLTEGQSRANGSAGACYGDSGGPTLAQVDGVTTLLAVTSTGDQPCWATNVASRVDRPSALSFLDEVMTAAP